LHVIAALAAAAQHAAAAPAVSVLRDAPVSICGRAYLLPTLKLSRNDTPHSLREKLRLRSVQQRQMFFNQSPIVLDLCDVSQDGSHHARPLTPEGLQDVLQVSLHKLYTL
jgi:hypothetical protein